MNIIASITSRIEASREENKQPCKNYASEARAEKAAAEMAALVAEHHGSAKQANYVVFFVESWGRWVGAIDLNEMISRKDASGGFLGLAPSKGFYTY